MKEIKKSIENFINRGLLNDAQIIIDEYKTSIGNDDEIAGMQSIINIYNGDYKEAIENIKDGLKYNIDNSDLYYTMGNIYELQGDSNRAYLAYEQSLFLVESDERREIVLGTIENLKNNYAVGINNISIVILTYNNLDYTKVCIDSIRKYNCNEYYEIIVVDNNSTDGTVQWLKEQKDLIVIFNEENRGFPAGCNQGILKAIEGNDIFLLNNDTVIMKNSIFNLRMGLYSSECIGATGSISNSISYYQQININCDDFNGYINFAEKNNITDEAQYEERLKLVGFAMLFKRNVLNLVGLLDERFSPGNFEDDDISLRIINEGYKLMLCKDSYIHHFGSVSFKSDVEKFNKLLQTNSGKFKEKWGFSSTYSLMIRNDIISKIDVAAEQKIRVLEVGCACGATLLKIKQIFPNAELYGLEINKESVKIANKIGCVQSINIETEELPFEKEFFDIIILPDVLEHLVDPWEAMKKLKEHLKMGGQVIASIPNVMNITIVDELLRGRWNYTDAGILDKTHMRFFTKSGIKEMFELSGFKELNISNNEIIISNELEFKVGLLSKLNQVDESEYRSYQYIISAKNEEVKVEKINIGNRDEENEIISFILCINDRKQFNICKEHILNLVIPKGYRIEIVTVENAKSMTSGYNLANNNCSGKFKIYIHQDTYIINKNAIVDMMKIFEDRNIGIIGVVGARKIPKDGIWWNDDSKYGEIYECRNSYTNLLRFGDSLDDFTEVECVDGCLIATQYDIEWDEENFDGWHFYDLSQCLETIKRNKLVVIPKQKTTWVMHDCGVVNVVGYNEYRKVFCDKYFGILDIN